MIIWDQFFLKMVFPVQNRKIKYHPQIPPIWINLCTKFHFKQIWIFGQNLLKKWVSGLQQKKWASPSDLAYSNYTGCQISVYINNFDFSRANLPKKNISSLKWKKSTSLSNFAYSNWIWYQIFASKETTLNFWAKFAI